MKFYWICILSCFWMGKSFATNVDSLVNLLNVYKADTNRVRVLNLLTAATYINEATVARGYVEEGLALSKQLKDFKGQLESLWLSSQVYYSLGLYDLGIQAGRDCIRLSQEINNRQIESDANAQVGQILYIMGQIDSAEVYYQKCLELSNTANYAMGIAKGLYGQGHIFESRGLYDRAMEQFQLSLKISMEIEDVQGQLKALNSVGIIHEYSGELEKSLEKYIETLRLAEKVGDLLFAGRANTNIASLYYIQKNFAKAIEYGKKSLACYEETNNLRGIAFAYHDMGNVLKAQRKLDEALIHYQKALEIRKRLSDKRGQSFTYFSMAWNYKRQNDLDTARYYMKKSLALRKELNFQSGIHACNKALAQWNMDDGRYKEAYPFLKDAFEWFKEAGEMEGIWESSAHLIEYYEKQGDFKNAFIYQKINANAKDSIFNNDQNKQFADMQTLYETEKKEKQILEQNNDILILEKTNTKIATQRNYILGGALGLGIFGIFGFQINRIRRERNDKKAFAEALMYAQESERKRIAGDLHDGIAQSLLLIKKQLEATTDVTAENQKLIGQTLEEVRAISHDLHPFQLEKFGLSAAVKEMLNRIKKSTDLFISSDIQDIENDRLTDHTQINLYRTIQEAFSNIIKHSDATAANITMLSSKQKLNVVVQDNGKGFDHELTIVTSKSLGLRTMIERVSSVGGKISIKKGKSGGVAIEIEVPYSQNPKVA